MKSKRIVLTVALLALSLSAISCTDQILVIKFPAECIGPKDHEIKAALIVEQDGSKGTQASTLINGKGEAQFIIGARSQKDRLFHSGHAPTAQHPKTIYTGDPVTITLQASGCSIKDKKFTGVLDQHLSGGGKYTFSVSDFK